MVFGMLLSIQVSSATPKEVERGTNIALLSFATKIAVTPFHGLFSLKFVIRAWWGEMPGPALSRGVDATQRPFV